MKKQEMVSSAGKKLSRNEMKKLAGGAVLAGGAWGCGTDGPCYPTKARCMANCPGKVCSISRGCLS